MIPELATVRDRIAEHAGEDFTLTGGVRFGYGMPGDYLLPVGHVGRLSRTNFGTALGPLPPENTLSVDDLQGSSYV